MQVIYFYTASQLLSSKLQMTLHLYDLMCTLYKLHLLKQAIEQISIQGNILLQKIKGKSLSHGIIIVYDLL